MRLNGKVKPTYHPLPLAAFNLISHRIKLSGTDNPTFAALDPCAGDGTELKQLLSLLKMPTSLAHAIDYFAERGQRIREAMPDAEVVAPCSVDSAGIPPHAYSLLYLNPPFDDSVSGERSEERFLANTFECLAPGGVLVFVCPGQVVGRDLFRSVIAKHFERVCVFQFEATYRKFNEVLVVGTRRKRALLGSTSYYDATKCEANHIWFVPPVPKPDPIVKLYPTDDELIDLLKTSPLNKLLEPKKTASIASPPLALGTGHLALLLSAGQLDGLISPPGEVPHVVRGTAKKVEEIIDSETTIDKGKKVVKEVITERIKLTIRVARHTGEIITLQ